MLHAPTGENKLTRDAAQAPAAMEPERILHPRYGQHWPHHPNASGVGGELKLPSAPAQVRRQVAHLHSAYGNQAVLRMLDSSRLAKHPTPSHISGDRLQAKLTISQPGDVCEQEADRVAEAVMRMPDSGESKFHPGPISSGPLLQRKCACGGSGGECEACKEKREESLLKRKAQGTPAEKIAMPAIVHDVLHSPGQPMDECTRSFMESRLGYDFRHVRVSSDERSARAADAIQAKAFTFGNRIVFGRNEYAPGLPSGLGLIAHELAHTAQQGSCAPSIQTNLRIGGVNDPQEREADLAANAVMGIGRKPSLSAGLPTIRRQTQGSYKWEWDGDEGVYTSAGGLKYRVTRTFKPVTESEPTTAEPGAEFAKAYITIKWCKNSARATAEAGVDITNQLQQLIPQMLATGNPAQVLRDAKLTPYIKIQAIWSERAILYISVEADVGRQGVTAVRGELCWDSPKGRTCIIPGVDLPPGGRPTLNVNVSYSPGAKPPEVQCETTKFEETYECRKEDTTPPRDVPIIINLPTPPRTRYLYFDYAQDIVTSSRNEYGKKYPNIVARNEATFADVRKDLDEGFRISAVAGFTSPEGPMPKPKDFKPGMFEGNIELAQKRAQAALDFFAMGRCALLVEEACFSPNKAGVRVEGKGELYTAFDKRGKELEGEALAAKAVPVFEEAEKSGAEKSALTAEEREALARKRGALAQAEVVYPLLRRAEITLVRAGTKPVTLWTEHLPGGVEWNPTACPAEVQQAAKFQFSSKGPSQSRKKP